MSIALFAIGSVVTLFCTWDAIVGSGDTAAAVGIACGTAMMLVATVLGMVVP